VPKFQARQAKIAAWETKAETRETTATTAGHTKIAKRIENRIDRVKKAEARGEKLMANITAKCGASGTPTPAN
jgi:hypothetical protein